MSEPRRILRNVSILAAVAILASPVDASAQRLRNFITDLYGGDGITLDRFGPFPHDAHFTQDSLVALNRLSEGLTSGLGVFAFNSTVSGFTFNVERGVPERTQESLGPLLGERATTIGRGKFNLAVSYTRVDYDRFEGNDLENLQLFFPHVDCCGAGFGPPDGRLGPPGPDFELDTVRVNVDLSIRQDTFAFFATYGLTNEWDVGLVVPIIHINARANAVATVVDNGGGAIFHRFGAHGDTATDSTGGSETGLGDVLFRTKYNFLKNHKSLPDMAVLGQISLPTGNEKDLLGTGSTSLKGVLIASKQYGIWTPHVNLGYDWSSHSERSNVSYLAGFDVRPHPKITLATEIIGRWEPEGDGIGDHLVDFAVGAKWNVVDTLILNANIQLPVNRNDGLRDNFIWTVGAEVTF